jgi:hypothetical protein
MVVVTWRGVRELACLCVFLMLTACSGGGGNSTSSTGELPSADNPQTSPQPAGPDVDSPKSPPGNQGSPPKNPPEDRPEDVNNAPDPELRSATVAWVAPVQNSDGSPLVGLRGYEIHFGTRSGSYDFIVKIDNPSVTRYVIDDLARGSTYYFALIAISENGKESRFSREVSTKI